MVIILIALCIPLTAFVVGVLVLKALQLGLKWQIQTEKKEEPTMEIKNPIQPIFEAKQTREVENIMDEWFNGPKESR